MKQRNKHKHKRK